MGDCIFDKRFESEMIESISKYLKKFEFENDLFKNKQTKIGFYTFKKKTIQKLTNEFWTAKQRQANSLHEISYRACFKPQLPRFFINLLTNQEDIVYDPFSGRGTTIIEAALLGRNIISNDINPLSKILSLPRLTPPNLFELENRLNLIEIDYELKAEIDLSMFYHSKTEAEIISLKKYLQSKKGDEDYLDNWIKMVATNRLTGHSKGFFPVYTLPPNQAVSPERQIKINNKNNQKPEYRDTKKIILKKSKSLLKDLSSKQNRTLNCIAKNAVFICKDARETNQILNNSVQLTVTSPPFLNVVQYAKDNWLRCWFNSIDSEKIGKKITMSKKIEDWCEVMNAVFEELFRITKRKGYVVFEVGEVKNRKVKLEEYVIPLALKAGFNCKSIMINEQTFTKTANIWGIKNNTQGTNTNRLVILKKK